MKKTNLHAAKTNLSKLIDLALQGEEVIICKAGNPVVRLVAIKPIKKKRRPGIWAGKVTIANDFDVLPNDFMQYFRCAAGSAAP
ncbi:MAG TPA: type II toxin-antitoxin system Phd/YefM family antitoxin [Candidatus Babeliales bacterium]|nr:type II toxin-antitoxin system Phd/YefM family antitoxin [Candidatus Babeliales bacterium]